MPLASLLADRFLALMAAGGGGLDWSALALIAKRDAGEDVKLSTVRVRRHGASEPRPQPTPPEPAKNCPLCPRLVAFRNDNRDAHPDWFNGAVPSFGPSTAKLLIVGLAPGLKGANRTGRPFLGDYAGELLYRTLLKMGLARGTA